MRIICCGLLMAVALLGPAPVAVADDLADANPAAPQAEVSMLALSLTTGGAIAAIASGVALVLARRREVDQSGAGRREINPASRKSG